MLVILSWEEKSWNIQLQFTAGSSVEVPSTDFFGSRTHNMPNLRLDLQAMTETALGNSELIIK